MSCQTAWGPDIVFQKGTRRLALPREMRFGADERQREKARNEKAVKGLETNKTAKCVIRRP
jgi:hypothetical protein